MNRAFIIYASMILLAVTFYSWGKLLSPAGSQPGGRGSRGGGSGWSSNSGGSSWGGGGGGHK